jgi:hypothetical protein
MGRELEMKRRELLKLGAAAGITVAATGCSMNGGFDDGSGSSDSEEEGTDEHFYLRGEDYYETLSERTG